MVLELANFVSNYLEESKLGQALLIVIGLIVIFTVYGHITHYVNVPAYGSHLPFLYQVGVFRYLRNSDAILAEGYRKYAIFKVPQTDGWSVITHGKYAEEVYKAPDDVLSFDAHREVELQIAYTLGSAIGNDPWHNGTVRGVLTRNLGTIFLGLRDETEASFEDVFQLEGEEWKTLNVYNMLLEVVARVNNRAFVGQSLCSKKEWTDLNVKHTNDVLKVSSTIKLFPMWLQPLVGRMLTNLSETQKHATKMILPLLEERRNLPAEERPADMLTWFMKEGPDHEKDDLYALSLRILAINFSAINTISTILTQGLYVLLAHPEYIETLRAECNEVIGEHGWTKTAVGHLHKCDSFLKEVSRYWGIGSISSGRTVLKPFTFSDGIRLPIGTRVFTLARPVHRDPNVYEAATAFKPFRWSEKRDNDLLDQKVLGARNNQLVGTSPNYVPWGYGKHACPGRFFAATELKCILSFLLMNFDLEWAPGEKWAPGETPPEIILGGQAVPNQNVEMKVRRRVIGGSV